MDLDTLPAVHEVLSHPRVERELSDIAPRYRTRLVRAVIARFRKAIQRDRNPLTSRSGLKEKVAEAVLLEAGELRAPFPRRVVNGTGILIHTNLGRAPLGDISANIDPAALAGYSDLEWDAAQQKRGSRDRRTSRLLELLTGAGSALAVNNCASALLLALEVLAPGKDVLVSRSELVEIGGGFRVPEIIEAGRCRLVEVGTTNKTRLDDYRKKAGKGGCVFLKVHQSNFSQSGFVESVSLNELSTLARRLRVPLVYDNGSGLLGASDLGFLRSEPSVEEDLKAGADIVVSSGDKLLGSVQAGLIFGRKSLVAAMRKNPLYRAMRLDKLRLALLHATLDRYLRDAEADVPVWQMTRLGSGELEARARTLRVPAGHPRWKRADWVPVHSSMGGGTSPGATFPSLGLALVHRDYAAGQLRAWLASRPIPITGYIQDGVFFLDIRTMLEGDFPELQNALDELSQPTPR
jgi:L-seryl-tRNA(Ser) seleniumtransferase